LLWSHQTGIYKSTAHPPSVEMQIVCRPLALHETTGIKPLHLSNSTPAVSLTFFFLRPASPTCTAHEPSVEHTSAAPRANVTTAARTSFSSLSSVAIAPTTPLKPKTPAPRNTSDIFWSAPVSGLAQPRAVRLHSSSGCYPASKLFPLTHSILSRGRLSAICRLVYVVRGYPSSIAKIVSCRSARTCRPTYATNLMTPWLTRREIQRPRSNYSRTASVVLSRAMQQRPFPSPWQSVFRSPTFPREKPPPKWHCPFS